MLLRQMHSEWNTDTAGTFGFIILLTTTNAIQPVHSLSLLNDLSDSVDGVELEAPKQTDLYRGLN